MATEGATKTMARVTTRAGNFGSRDYLSQFCNKGCMAEAFNAVSLMDQEGIPITRDVIYCLLQGCAKKKDSGAASHLHALMIAKGFHTLDFLAGHLIRVFALCGNLTQAYHAFDDIPKPTVHSWNAIILASANLGNNERALELLNCMQQHGIQADNVTLQGTLKACINMGFIKQGRVFHGYIIEGGLDSDIALKNTLIDMYAKCGSIDEARNTFDRMRILTLVSWGSIIAGYAMHGDCYPALELFQRMQHDHVKPNNMIFSSVLKACGHMEALQEGRIIHHQVIKSGLQSDVVVGNTLVHLYVKCGSLEEAYKVFQNLPHHTEMSWGALMAGYAIDRLPVLSSHSLDEMQQDGLSPNRVIFLSLLKSCYRTGCMKQGMLIHDHLIRNGLDCDVLVSSSLVDMYAKCGGLEDAHKMFETLHDPTVVSWGALIAGYVMHGHGWHALELAKKMQEGKVKPDRAIYLCILKACATVGAVHDGRLVHAMIIETGFETDLAVGSTLVDFYGKLGFLVEARTVFDNISNRDVVPWSAIITGCVQHGLGLVAIELYKEMQEEGMEPNEVTLVSSLKACGNTGAIKEGRLIHCQIIESRLESDLIIGNSVLEMYVQCGVMDEACKVFEKLPVRDVLSWSMMMEGCALYGKCTLAGRCLEELQHQGLRPDECTFTHMLTACVQAGRLDEGLHYFKCMREDHGVEPSTEHYSCMVDLLGRAGCINDAKDLLYSIPITPSMIMWTSLLTSCRTHGSLEIGRQCFDQVMQLDPSDASSRVLVSNLLTEACMWEDFDHVQGLQKCQGVQKMPKKSWM